MPKEKIVRVCVCCVCCVCSVCERDLFQITATGKEGVGVSIKKSNQAMLWTETGPAEIPAP